MLVACIVLAAGQSTRFGAANKLLAEIDGRPVIHHVVSEALASRSTSVHVIIQPDSERITSALAGLPVTHCINRDFTCGIGTSIATGIRSLPHEITGALILPADMPWMRALVLDELIAAFENSGCRHVTIPITAAGEQRNPVLWPRNYFAALSKLHADQGAKPLIPKAHDRCQKVIIGDELVFLDVDRPSDLSP